MIFYLGTHHESWLSRVDVPLFISHRRLRKRKGLPSAMGRWALDSGAFSELASYGEWTVSPQQYASDVARYRAEIGNLDFAAIQDWMCEPHMLKRTGRSIPEHQELTVQSFENLLALQPTLPWLPVLQGFAPDDYLRHLDLYDQRGLRKDHFGVGSICKRQGTAEIGKLLERLAVEVPKIHGFGVKTSGLRLYGKHLHSADSLAWSFNARRRPVRLPGHTHINCANCLEYALRWREQINEDC